MQLALFPGADDLKQKLMRKTDSNNSQQPSLDGGLRTTKATRQCVRLTSVATTH
jgi:hypothetical protein